MTIRADDAPARRRTSECDDEQSRWGGRERTRPGRTRLGLTPGREYAAKRTRPDGWGRRERTRLGWTRLGLTPDREYAAKST